MALNHVSHPHVILFLLCVGIICFGMYFIIDVSPMHILASSSFESNNIFAKLVISDQCADLILDI